MSPRTGRPIIGKTKKEHRLQLRLNDEEMALINECAERMKTNRTEVVNKGVQLVKAELDKEKE